MWEVKKKKESKVASPFLACELGIGHGGGALLP